MAPADSTELGGGAAPKGMEEKQETTKAWAASAWEEAAPKGVEERQEPV